jgi:hypothetical protein
MKLVSSLIGTVIISLTTTAFANEPGCSSISFQHSNIGNKTVLVELLNSNNNVPERGDNRLYSLDFVSEKTNFILEEGEHTLLSAAWTKRDYRKWLEKAKFVGWENLGALAPLYKGVPINSNVRIMANQHYTLAVKSQGDNKFSLYIANVEPKQCMPANAITLKAANSSENQNVTLPPQLESKLRILMNNLAETDTNAKYGNIIGMEAELDFGVTGNWSEDNRNFKILAIKPFSEARKLGLLSGDLLTKVNNLSLKKQSGNSNALSDIFNDMHLGQEYTLSVTRNSKEISLSGIVDINVIPGGIYRINPDEKRLINRNKLSSVFAAEYKNVTMEITQYLKKHRVIGENKFSIHRAEKLITHFGITGKVSTQQQKTSFKVTNVLPGSYADNAGVKVDDEILSYNNKDNIDELLDSASFKESLGEAVILKVNRNDIEQQLSVVLTPKYNVAFDVVINTTDKNDLVTFLSENTKDDHVLVRNLKRQLEGRPLYFHKIFRYSRGRSLSSSQMTVANTTGGHGAPAKPQTKK